MAKLIYRTNDGLHNEEIKRDEWSGWQFSNGVPIEIDHLKFYAQHCDARIELSLEEFKRACLPEVIEIKVINPE